MTTVTHNSAVKPKPKPQNHLLTLTIQFVSLNNKSHRALLKKTVLSSWIKIALFQNAIITLRFVDEMESQSLNKHYRQRNYATNVLTFCYQNNDNNSNLMASLPRPQDAHANSIISDIVICSTVIEKEAIEQNKSLAAHYAHMIIHSILHAQGYRHDTKADQTEMEALEIKLLLILGFANPYM